MKNLILFFSGLTIGAGAAYIMTKNIYEKIAADKIDEVRLYYEEKEGNFEKDLDIESDNDSIPEDNVDNALHKPKLEDVENIVRDYTTFSKNTPNNVQSVKENNMKKENEKIEIITEEEYQSSTEYLKRDLTYYSEDDVLADDGDEEIDVDEIIGSDALNHFGEEDDPDIIHVRNHEEQTDYEVVRANCSYWKTVGMINGEYDE